MYRSKSFLTFLFLFLLLSALLFTSSSLKNGETGRRFVDFSGKEVVINKKITRIISLSPANTEILFALGAESKIVGVTDYCNYPADALKKDKVGGFSDISIEKVVDLSPDLVIASNYHISTIVPAIEKFNIPVVIIDPVNIAGVFDAIKLISDMINAKEAGDKLVKDLMTQYEAITKKIKNSRPVRVFWEISSDLWTAGQNSFIDDIITRAGGQNIAGSLPVAWGQLSSEIVIDKNPELIFLADQPYGEDANSVSARPGWSLIDAVKNNNIIGVTVELTDIMSRCGPRVIEALTFVAKAIHPELFK